MPKPKGNKGKGRKAAKVTDTTPPDDTGGEDTKTTETKPKKFTLWFNPKGPKTGSVSKHLAPGEVAKYKLPASRLAFTLRRKEIGKKPIVLPDASLYNYFRKLTSAEGLPLFVEDDPYKEED